ncbi:tail protein X [Salinicola socius]|uniref:Phage tail protein n=1 Tax=Salinicola socius TaxID=404433 RepID=A0A1Q8SUM8_9GAMM|nr:tail protein X [Salinicola socius]OLO05116.1 phage tail protein [Salinicola socius]
MPRIVYAHQYDTVDAICQRVYGRTAGVTEQLLEQNPGLADLGPMLPQGTAITLPDVVQQPQRSTVVQLWD